MQAVIDLALNVLAALTLAVMAQLGLNSDETADKPVRAERVVARSAETRAAPLKPQHAEECPDQLVVRGLAV